MTKFFIFEKMLAFMSDHTEVTDANMNYYHGCMRIVGEADGEEITLQVCIEKKEEPDEKL